jgi:hypothetical protein
LIQNTLFFLVLAVTVALQVEREFGVMHELEWLAAGYILMLSAAQADLSLFPITKSSFATHSESLSSLPTPAVRGLS